MNRSLLEEMRRNAVSYLLARRNAEGHWEGRLSSSALSTATAVIAFAAAGTGEDLVLRGRSWLIANQNPDGGWGDTVLSVSNISTTALCWAALPDAEPAHAAANRAAKWLAGAAGSTEPSTLARAIEKRYGKDRTFSVPILTALTIGGRLGAPADAWRRVPQLPFELAACPHQWFQWLRLPVVSYALPALIAIGLARHRCRPSHNPVTRGLRNLLTARTLRILEHIQPSCGGFLEATPLTSFCAMSLISAGLVEHAVTELCLKFLRQSIREDGSWPIDTNLATWLTTLAINGLAAGPGGLAVLQPEERAPLNDWLLAQQFREEHPYTHTAPGAWSWTNLPGAVPDADDTPGALLALHHLGDSSPRTLDAARRGVHWLLDLQNRDGGMPTFCRGWGHLPFDRSGADLTAHAIRAWLAWLPKLEPADRRQVKSAIHRATSYLKNVQRPDGSWIPLWFGNQHAPSEENPTFGTARVVDALCGLPASPELMAGVKWLLSAQNPDGGWGGSAGVSSSVEETALALGAIAHAAEAGVITLDQAGAAIDSAIAWLSLQTGSGARFPYSPIGFYFASLWYFEELYPALFAVASLQRAARVI